jgi:low affinity Fe/Cu permease
MAGTSGKKTTSTKRRTGAEARRPHADASVNMTVGINMNAFERFATAVARLAGRPAAFSLAVVLIAIWAACGPLFGFCDTWQLVVNTSTTIITFLRVFLIQHTQNRDSLAIQIKLAELILAAKGAENEVATAEERSEKYLEQLHEALRDFQGRR